MNAVRRFAELATEAIKALGFDETFTELFDDFVRITVTTGAGTWWVTATNREIEMNPGREQTISLVNHRVNNGYRTWQAMGGGING